jgi:DNA-binding transcriptional MerR regulator
MFVSDEGTRYNEGGHVNKGAPENKAKGLRMRELTEETGLPKSTILHYVAQGLLPDPVKTSRNMAFYDPECIERARYIKEVQNTYSFPLEKIKKLLKSRDEGKDPAALMELHAVVFGSREGVALDEKAFRHATGLTARQVVELLDVKLLLPLDQWIFRQEDVDAGKSYAAAFALGLNASDLAFYRTIAEALVDQEMRLRERLTSHLPDDQDARITTQLTRGARALRNYVVDRVFQHRVAAAKTLKDKEALS